jgi:threo-3-hydroxy-L-aspartate ammonia-lyase
MVNLDAIYAETLEAHRVLDSVIRRTPLLPYREGVYLKAENLQRSGSFKFRGAYYTIRTMDAHTQRTGVVAYSTGNHAQAVALAAAVLGVSARIVMSPSAPPEKIRATQTAGAEVVFATDSSLARKQHAEALAARHGYGLVPPYEHPSVIAAQGTVAVELLETLPEVGTLVVPVGGGGLLAGIAVYAKRHKPALRVIGVEPTGAADGRASFTGPSLVAVEHPSSVCDGLCVQQLGETNFAIIRQLVDDIVVIVDALTLVAMRRLLLEAKVSNGPPGRRAL